MSIKKNFTLFFAIFALLYSSSLASTTEWKSSEGNGAKTKLVASFYKNQNGEIKLIAGLHFKLDSGWKMYGQDSGGIGVPPSFDFKNSTNYLKHNIYWPKAHSGTESIGTETVNYFYYKDEVVLPIEIDLTDINKITELKLKLFYGLCKEVCIPVNQEFTLAIDNKPDLENLKLIEKFYPNKLIIDSDEKTDDAKTQRPRSSSDLILGIAAAIFGGLILNIMPCVLPVLSIKLISVVNHSDAKTSRIRFAFFSTIVGILFCFIIFAFFATLIRLTGNSLGWGLQFQNPYFLIFLILILMFFIANLIGIFEISFSQFLATLINKKISEKEEEKNIFIPNFLSGVLAVLLATPCSAPFLGSAISFALIQEFYIIFIIFFAIGIGFSIPYIIFLITPKLINLLPKPGNWMIKIKQLMVGLLIATVAWLIYILSDNIGTIPAFLIGAFATILIACLKIKMVFFRFLSLAMIIAVSFSMPKAFQKHQVSQKENFDQMWVQFDEEKLYKEIIKGNVVLVDITADWCITCKFNKINVLQSEEIMVKLENGSIIGMRGDITKPNEEIMNFLRKHNRYAIPFNIIYGPNAKNGLLASELLTKKELLKLIKQAS